MKIDTMRGGMDESEMAAAATAGDETAFTALTRRYRRELQVHCYRMLASFEDAEDMVQETFLRAWQKRETFQGRAPFRAWLYRIATNACLDFLARHERRVVRLAGGSARCVAAAVSRSAPRAARAPGWRARCLGRSQGDDRARLPRRDAAPATEATRSADPLRCAGLVRERNRVAPGIQRRVGERCAAAGASRLARAPTRARHGPSA